MCIRDRLSVGALTVNAAAVKAIVSGTVDAHVGSAAGTTPSTRLADIDLTGALTVDAHAAMTATPTVKAANISIIDVSVLLPIARLAGIVRAYVGEGVDINAASAVVKAAAPSLAASASASGAGFSALVGIGVLSAEATVSTPVSYTHLKFA